MNESIDLNKSEESGAVHARRDRLRRVDQDETLPFTSHLEELRLRLIYCSVTIFVVFCALYSVSDYLFELFREPMGDYQIIAIAPTEAFFAYLKVSFYMALIISTPLLLFHVWEFVAPGLLENERRYTGLFVVFGTLFFVLGGLFCYFLVLPYGLSFLLGYAGDSISAQITASNYISFTFKLIIAFGVIFQLPIVIILLTKIGVVTPDALSEKRPFFIVGSFIVAAIMTPPDVFTQIIMAGPMIILFETSVLVSRLFIVKKDE